MIILLKCIKFRVWKCSSSCEDQEKHLKNEQNLDHNDWEGSSLVVQCIGVCLAMQGI